MYLSKLTINGFKSFANRTQFDLTDGLTGIIGPNGCGKSNIVDAIRWVLGEQKVSSLRSDKMENVIFNGTGDRKPLGMAEVALTIENNKKILPSEFTEVVIARRLFRSGESQYLLNSQPVRLKDIQNLFIDTGMSTDAYSIIELKMVELILSDNKEERRRLFEEAAGIKKYKMHRRAALRKLDQTQQELTRLTDIITEVKRSVNSLARQVSKTKRYQELKEELRQKEINSHVYKYQQYLKATGPLNEELKDIISSKEKFATQVTQKESELEKVKKVVLDIEREFQEIQRNLAKEQGQLQELEKENLVDKQRLEMLNREIDRARQELATTRIRIEGVINFIESNQPRLKEFGDEEIRVDAQFEEVKQEKLELTSKLESHKEQLHKKEKNSRELFQKISHMQEEINQKKFQIESKTEEKIKLEAQVEIIKESQGNKDSEYSGLKEKTDILSVGLNTLEEKNVQFINEKENKEKSLQENKDQLYQLEKTLSNLEKEIKIYQNILESYEGYSSAIQYVMQNLSQNGNVLDTLPNLFSVDADIQEELSHFLAELANIVVVKDADAAENVLNNVQDNKQGALSIVPAMELNKASSTKESIDAEPLLNFIQAAPEHENIVKNLFNNVYRTSSLKKAISLHKQYPYLTFIAPNGYTMGSFIQIKGGSKNSSLTNLVGRKNHIKKLKAEHIKVESQHKEVFSIIEKNKVELSELNDKILSLETDLKEKRVEFEIVSRELQKNEIERNSINEKLNDAVKSIDEHKMLIAKWEEKLSSLKPELENMNFEYDNGEDELEELRKDTEYVEDDLKKTSDDYNRLNLELVQLRNQFQSLDSDLSRNKGTLAELEKKREELEQEGLKQNDESMSALEIKIKDRTEILHEMMSVFGEKEKQKNEKEEIYQEHKNQLLMVEEEIFKSRRNWNQAQERIKELEFKIQEHELKANGIQEQLMEYYNHEITEEVNFDDFNPERNKVDIEEINNKLLKIGEVNLLAIDEHKKEKERFEFLQEQEADILEAEGQLLETIDELNKTAIEKFNVTYEAIRINFHKVFKEFFAQGDADLELIDRNDPLESDINIKVTPKGRKLQTLTLMSAGEKTLTAISLLFAIYLVKPSPFCILDEVDAPLDDVNIGRYTGALNNFSGNTQFIVVTHNKKTMEKMDSIYGITMEQEGVSKVVSVKFD